jgi:hypothetical protein
MIGLFIDFCRKSWRWRHPQSGKTLSSNMGSSADVRSTSYLSNRSSDVLSNRLAGPPLTNDTNLVSLIENQVTVAIGVPEAWAARNARFDIAWVSWLKFLPVWC